MCTYILICNVRSIEMAVQVVQKISSISISMGKILYTYTQCAAAFVSNSYKIVATRDVNRMRYSRVKANVCRTLRISFIAISPLCGSELHINVTLNFTPLWKYYKSRHNSVTRRSVQAFALKVGDVKHFDAWNRVWKEACQTYPLFSFSIDYSWVPSFFQISPSPSHRAASCFFLFLYRKFGDIVRGIWQRLCVHRAW